MIGDYNIIFCSIYKSVFSSNILRTRWRFHLTIDFDTYTFCSKKLYCKRITENTVIKDLINGDYEAFNNSGNVDQYIDQIELPRQKVIDVIIKP